MELSLFLIQPLRDPDFDDRLARYAEALRFFVERLNHPDRKIDVDSSLFLFGAVSLRNIEILRDVFPAIEFLVELLSLDRFQPLLFLIDERI